MGAPFMAIVRHRFSWRIGTHPRLPAHVHLSALLAGLAALPMDRAEGCRDAWPASFGGAAVGGFRPGGVVAVCQQRTETEGPCGVSPLVGAR